MVFQQDTVFPWMHVRDNVEFPLRCEGRRAASAARIADRWIEAVGLSKFAESWPRELSGGMRKRVALAAVLAAGADVWLMDEPFGSLDYFTRRGLHDLLLDLWREEPKTVFFVTHDIEEALILADRILVIDRGELVADLAVDLARPAHRGRARAHTTAVHLTTTVLERLGFELASSQAGESHASEVAR